MIKSVTSKYLIDNDQDVSWGLTINTVGFQHIDPGQPYPPKSHPEGYSFLANKGRTLEEYQFVYITKGKGYFSSKDLTRKNFRRVICFFFSQVYGIATILTTQQVGMNTG